MTRRPSANSSLTQEAYERLRADILSCRLRPGVRLLIGELCQDMQVSLSAVREALARLTAEDLVIAEPQRGFRVAPISMAELLDLTQTRIQIETLCLERTVAQGGIEWETQLVAAFHRLSRTSEREGSDPLRMNEEWSTAHASFHEALVGACDSVWLLRLRRMLYAQTERYRRLSVPLGKTKRGINQEHQDLMSAALERDLTRVAALIRRHLETTTRMLLQQSWLEPPKLPAAVKRRSTLA